MGISTWEDFEIPNSNLDPEIIIKTLKEKKDK